MINEHTMSTVFPELKMPEANLEIIETDVLIVGGGACGMMSSIILSDAGIDHLLVEARSTTTALPKAHYLNPRTMEIFRQHGVAQSIYEAAMPLSHCTTRFMTSLGGDGPLDGKELFVMDAFGGNSRRATSRRLSHCLPTNIPQLRLEPLLRSHADARAPERIRFNHEVIEFGQDDEGVDATIRDAATDRTYRVRAKYMIAADGGKTIGPALGLTQQTTGRLATLCTFHITADLSQWLPGDAQLTWFMHPESPYRWGVLIQLGPTWGRHSEEWAFNFAYTDPSQRLKDEEVIPAIRQCLKLPELEMTVHRGSEWGAECSVTDQFRVGRIFVGGDAAHRVIPTSGLGLNSAVHDAHNLSWKLAAVLKGTANPSLLDSYETERRAAAWRNHDWSLFTFRNHAVTQVGLGFAPGGTLEQNAASISEYLSDTPMGQMLRARAKEVVGIQRTEFGQPEIEMGITYNSDAIVPDGTPAPEIDPMGDNHVPATRPGHRLPHGWIEHAGLRISTHDLTGASEAFVLITGSDGLPWISAATNAAKALGIKMQVARIGLGGERPFDYVDVTGEWDTFKAIDQDGAVLVRPDGYVAFRSKSMPVAPEQVLINALTSILGRDNDAVAVVRIT
jgi:2,4-dichlorophenol 6-monooxygenase